MHFWRMSSYDELRALPLPLYNEMQLLGQRVIAAQNQG